MFGLTENKLLKKSILFCQNLLIGNKETILRLEDPLPNLVSTLNENVENSELHHRHIGNKIHAFTSANDTVSKTDRDINLSAKTNPFLTGSFQYPKSGPLVLKAKKPGSQCCPALETDGLLDNFDPEHSDSKPPPKKVIGTDKHVIMLVYFILRSYYLGKGLITII